MCQKYYDWVGSSMDSFLRQSVCQETLIVVIDELFGSQRNDLVLVWVVLDLFTEASHVAIKCLRVHSHTHRLGVQKRNECALVYIR